MQFVAKDGDCGENYQSLQETSGQDGRTSLLPARITIQAPFRPSPHAIEVVSHKVGRGPLLGPDGRIFITRYCAAAITGRGHTGQLEGLAAI
ncbi:hypothetical protein KPB2_5583 [Klebsiella pneumoniae Kb677]|nr:hypothetical protein KPB2_5583 [Klebsiella pneumoniae Kb677]